MADNARDIYIVGLRNQHAVENQAVELLERQVGRLENYPEMRERLRRHIVRHNSTHPRDPIGYQPGGVPNAPWCVPMARLRRYVRDQHDD